MAEVEPWKPAALLANHTLCQACRRLNVEDLSSPDGQAYVVNNPYRGPCQLCIKIFELEEYYDLRNTTVRLKIRKQPTEMGYPVMGLYLKLGTMWKKTSADVYTDGSKICGYISHASCY